MHILVNKRGTINLVETVLKDRDVSSMEPRVIRIEDSETHYEFLLIKQDDICQDYEQIFDLYVRPVSTMQYDWARIGMFYNNKSNATIVSCEDSFEITPNIIRAGIYLDSADMEEDIIVKSSSYDGRLISVIADTCRSTYYEDSTEWMSWSCIGYSRAKS